MNPYRPHQYKIRRRINETSDTFTLELASVNGGISPFQPGQFNMLYVFGVGEIPVSISGDPAVPDRIVHTTRVVGAVTRALDKLRPGDTIGVRGPFGTAWPVTQAEGYDVVIVAGGIGLAPLRPSIYHIIAHRERYGRVCLCYGARTPDDLLYLEELQSWRGRFDFDVQASVDVARSGWRGHVGVVTKLLSRVEFDATETMAMICGPEIMMRYAVMELSKRGVPAEQMHLSMERNMKCGVGLCGHCQYGGEFVCKDGPVFKFDDVQPLFHLKEV